MKVLILVLLSLLFVSCSSNTVKYINNNSTEPMHFHVAVIKDLNETSFKDIWYITDSMQSCFENAKSTDNIVTTIPQYSEEVFKILFYNNSSINLKRVQDGKNNQFIMEAYEEMQIKYDIAYCTRTIDMPIGQETWDVVSYKITSINKLK